MPVKHINCFDGRSQIPKRHNVTQSGQGEREGGEAAGGGSSDVSSKEECKSQS